MLGPFIQASRCRVPSDWQFGISLDSGYQLPTNQFVFTTISHGRILNAVGNVSLSQGVLILILPVCKSLSCGSITPIARTSLSPKLRSTLWILNIPLSMVCCSPTIRYTLCRCRPWQRTARAPSPPTPTCTSRRLLSCLSSSTGTVRLVPHAASTRNTSNLTIPVPQAFVRPRILFIDGKKRVNALLGIVDPQFTVHTYYGVFEPSTVQSKITTALRHRLPFLTEASDVASFPDRRGGHMLASLARPDLTSYYQVVQRYTLWSLSYQESGNVSPKCTRTASYIWDADDHDEPPISTFGHKILVMARSNTGATPAPELVDFRPRFDESCVVRRLLLPAHIDSEWLGEDARSMWVLSAKFAMDFELGTLFLLGRTGKLAIVQY